MMNFAPLLALGRYQSRHPLACLGLYASLLQMRDRPPTPPCHPTAHTGNGARRRARLRLRRQHLGQPPAGWLQQHLLPALRTILIERAHYHVRQRCVRTANATRAAQRLQGGGDDNPSGNPTARRRHADGAFIRQPAVAGRFYPANGVTLAGEVQRLLAAGRPPPRGARDALVAPHAGYACSGEVAGAAYRTLAGSPPDIQRTVYLLGPSATLEGRARGGPLRRNGLYHTLGQVEVAADRVHQLAALGGQYHVDDGAHAPEHCPRGSPAVPANRTPRAAYHLAAALDDGANPEHVADDLCTLLEGCPDDLVAVSTDLSHYHPTRRNHSRPSPPQGIGYRRHGGSNTGEACGLLPVLCLMYIAQRFAP